MRVLCPAKINLDLRVGPPRADGFHPIKSWFVTVGLFDTLEFRLADDLSLTCSDRAVPADARNLVWRATEALRPAGRPGVAITLTKRIPSGGGLGGGSSDAAATLIALNEFWQLGHDIDHLHAIAATLGSDVPFFLHGPSSVCTGRGDVVTPVPPPIGWAVLILPDIMMPTPAVFRRLDQLRPAAAPPESFETPTAASAAGLLTQLVNDLERPAFDLRPDLSELRVEIEQRLRQPVRMSGSGSTLFTLFDDGDAAAAVAELISGRFAVRTVAVPLAASLARR